MVNYDHFSQKCPNTPTDDEMGHSVTEQASLEMMTHDNLPFNSNGEVEYLNCKRQGWHHLILPIESKTGEKVSYIKNKEAMYLSKKQANYIYKKVEEGKVINTNTMKG